MIQIQIQRKLKTIIGGYSYHILKDEYILVHKYLYGWDSIEELMNLDLSECVWKNSKEMMLINHINRLEYYCEINNLDDLKNLKSVCPEIFI